MVRCRSARQQHAFDQLTLLQDLRYLRFSAQYVKGGKAVWWISLGGVRHRFETREAERAIQQVSGIAGLIWEPVPQPGGRAEREMAAARTQVYADSVALTRGVPQREVHAGAWDERLVLPPVLPPPVDLVRVEGAKLIRIADSPDGDPTDGRRLAVVLAFAQMADRGWAGLTAWAGSFKPQSGEQTERARWGWLRLLPDRYIPQDPPDPVPEGAHWSGLPRDSELRHAIYWARFMTPGDAWTLAGYPRSQWPHLQRSEVQWAPQEQ